MICRKFLVSGKVQGVFFRASTRREARALGLTGHAINLPDGRVEVLACGSEDAVGSIERWLHSGPSGAIVDSVEPRDAGAEPPDDFTTG